MITVFCRFFGPKIYQLLSHFNKLPDFGGGGQWVLVFSPYQNVVASTKKKCSPQSVLPRKSVLPKVFFLLKVFSRKCSPPKKCSPQSVLLPNSVLPKVFSSLKVFSLWFSSLFSPKKVLSLKFSPVKKCSPQGVLR